MIARDKHWLKRYRDARRLSQESLAETLNWTDDKVSRVERRKYDLTVYEVREIGDKLGLSQDEVGNILLEEAGLVVRVTGSSKDIREEQRFEIETHVAGVCLKKTSRGFEILVGKRSPTRALYPGKWECGGGQVKPGESFEEAVQRQMAEEFGVRVRVLMVGSVYEIPTPQLAQGKIPGVRFLCELEGYTGRDIELNQREFSEYKWVKEHELRKIDFIEGIRQQIEDGLSRYRNLQGQRQQP